MTTRQPLDVQSQADREPRPTLNQAVDLLIQAADAVEQLDGLRAGILQAAGNAAVLAEGFSAHAEAAQLIPFWMALEQLLEAVSDRREPR